MTELDRDEKRQGLFWYTFEDETKRPATVNLAQGEQVYGEQIISKETQEFRIWDPYRSKLAAALLRGLQAFGFTPGVSVLYLGASSGTTASHVSDLVGAEGIVYSVEFAPRVMRDLIRVCATRPNMIPIQADARNPENYLVIPQLVDVLYQDVAQPNQSEILIGNARRFLKSGGVAYVAIKSRSIDVIEKPKRIFIREETKLKEAGFTIVDRISLEPYSTDHIFLSAIFG